MENLLIDRLIRIAQVLALLWIGYELHALANPEPDAAEPDVTVESMRGSSLRG